MIRNQTYDAVVVGAGPNGLGAAITLAQAGKSVILFEARETLGGGARTAELTLPGFKHDICSAIHPMGVTSPFFKTLELDKYGLEWIQPYIPLAHPLDDGTAVLVDRSVILTAETLGPDEGTYRELIGPLAADWDKLATDLLGPLRLPHHPFVFTRFGLRAFRSARGLAKTLFKGERARALFAGMAAHSMLPLEKPGSAAIGMVMCISAHAVGWPLARGGSQMIAAALSKYLRSIGGEISTGTHIESIEDLPEARAIILNVTPRQLLTMVPGLSDGYRQKLARYRYGPGIFKVDWALKAPIPWKAEECSRAGSVHLGGTMKEIAAAERAVWRGEHPEQPFVVLAQQSLFDSTRAPQGKHTAWGYCHVPNSSTFDMTERIEEQIERFAPGFKKCIITRNIMPPAELERYNPNYIGGDILGGVHDIWHQLVRPSATLGPYETPVKGLYICSSSTPPGPGVHGMCGFHAAQAALSGVLGQLSKSRSKV
jgi:phytoene dehydrogenase-like protein